MVSLGIYRYEYDEGDLLYELEVYDHQGEGNSVQWFQQYKGMPRGSAEISLVDYLTIRGQCIKILTQQGGNNGYP